MRSVLFAAVVFGGCTGSLGGSGAGGGSAAEAAGCEPTSFALSRLNRRELDAAFASLLGDQSAPARLFVADSVDPGAFDNAASSLSIAPQLVADLETASARLIDDAWARDTATSAPTTGGAQQQTGAMAQATVGAARGSDWNLWSNGEARFTFNVAAGAQHVRLDLYGDQAGTEPARVDVWLNNAFVRSDAVPGTQQAHTLVEFDATVPAGVLTIGLRFPNDVYDAATGLDRNLLISSVTVTPASAQQGPAAGTAKWVRTCTASGDGRDCAREILTRFTRRAWRRAASGDELAGLLGLYDATRADGDDFDTATRLALRAVLLSPFFLMRTEAVMSERGPRSPEAVAARLSFFLWGAPPDLELQARVDDGTLLDDGVVEAQVDRMLLDARASALRTHLVEQWFDARDVQGFALDPGLFVGVNPSVMKGVQRQFDAWVEELFFQDHDALDVFDAPVTFVDSALAGFLGLPAPAGDAVERRVLPADDVRAGLFGQSAPLIVTSRSTETNPPRRGRWVMERLLCQPIPLPVGIDIPPVPPATPDKPTARDRLETLTSPASCTGCHASLNPVGFGLENFGADSRWRTMDHGAAIDPSGTFRGQAFSTPGGLAAILKQQPSVPTCMVRQTLSYALGKELHELDADTVQALGAQFDEGGRRYRQLIRAVALSAPMKNGCTLK